MKELLDLEVMKPPVRTTLAFMQGHITQEMNTVSQDYVRADVRTS